MLGAKPVYQLGHQRADARLRAGRQALLRVPEGSPGGLHGVITPPPPQHSAGGQGTHPLSHPGPPLHRHEACCPCPLLTFSLTHPAKSFNSLKAPGSAVFL